MISENNNAPELGFIPKGLFIGGKWEESTNGKRFETINPSNQQYLGDVPLEMERETGFEPATSTLARLRSTS